MARETNKRILKEIMATSESISTTKDLIEIWNQRAELIWVIVLDFLRTQPGYTSLCCMGKNTVCMPLDEKIGIGFDEVGSLGFVTVCDKDGQLRDMSDAVSRRLEKIMTQVDFGDDFGPISREYNYWVWRTLNGDTVNESIESLQQRVLRILADLARDYRKVGGR